MSKEQKTETIQVSIGSDRKVDSTGESRVPEAMIKKIRAIQAAAAREAQRRQSQEG